MHRPVSSTLKTASEPALKSPLRSSTMPMLAPSTVPTGREASAAAPLYPYWRSRRSSCGGCRSATSAPGCDREPPQRGQVHMLAIPAGWRSMPMLGPHAAKFSCQQCQRQSQPSRGGRAFFQGSSPDVRYLS